jgi:Bacterial archaeo-eukaryotic release factor family 12
VQPMLIRTKKENIMVGIAGLYFIMASRNRARFVRQGEDGALHTIEIVDVMTVRSPSRRRAPRRFLALLAARIRDDFAVDLFTRLVLVGTPEVLAELTALLDATTTASLIGSLARDLIDVPDLELFPHLRPWLNPDDDDG